MKNKNGKSTPEVAPEGASQDEIDRRLESALRAGASRILEAEKLRGAKKMLDILDELEEDGDPSDVPNFGRANDPVHEPARGVAKLSHPQDYLYSRMSDEERQWRNPESDHWMAEWLRASVKRDHTGLLQSNAELDRMFGRAGEFAEGDAVAAGALSDGAAGHYIPRPLENVVMIARDRVAKMRRFATIMPMTRQTHTIPTAGAMSAAMIAESSVNPTNSGTPSSVQITAMKGQAKAVSTIELLNDSAINLVSMLSTRAGGALGVLEDDQFFRLGSGSAPDTVKIDGTAYAETTSTFLPYADILEMYYTLTQAYRDRAIWLVASDVLQMLSNVRDGANGRPFYQGLTDVPGAITDDRGQVGSILRRPVYEAPFSDGDIWFGEVAAQYVIGQRQGIQMAASEHILWESDQISWKWTMRFAGINVDASASQYAKGITSATSL